MLTESTTRRSFSSVLINLIGGAIAAAAAVPAAVYLLVKPKATDTNDWAEVADIRQLQVGKPQEIVYSRKRTDGWRKVVEKVSTWVVRTDQNKVVAFNPSCTHLGCAYHWENSAKQFICPCHGSAFTVDGKVVKGPAPRNLDRYVCRIESNKVLVSPEIDGEVG